MAIRTNTNVPSLNAQRNLQKSQTSLHKAFEQLSSGLRINRAADDAAGLAIAENIRAEIDTSAQAIRNTNDGVSLLSIADGTLSTTSDSLIRLQELATQAANGTVSDDERVVLDQEFQAIKAEINRVSGNTTFNGDAVFNSQRSFQTGTDGTTTSQTTVAIGPNDTNSLGIASSNLLSQASAASAIDEVKGSIDIVSQARGQIGATEARLGVQLSNLTTKNVELASARSRIIDADIATVAARKVAADIQTQAGVAVLAQANSQPSLALRLLQNRTT